MGILVIVQGLVHDSSNIANVVRVGPRSFQRSAITCAAQVAHHPESRPKTRDIVEARHLNLRSKETISEAKLVPRLQHATAEIEIMLGVIIEVNSQ